jgi:hypothetical protein
LILDWVIFLWFSFMFFALVSRIEIVGYSFKKKVVVLVLSNFRWRRRMLFVLVLFVEMSAYEVLTKKNKKNIKNDYFNKIDKNLDNRMEDNFESD